MLTAFGVVALTFMMLMIESVIAVRRYRELEED
jgi:hypothetical protein